MILKRLSLLALAVLIGSTISACNFSDSPATMTCWDYGQVILTTRTKGKPQRADTGESMWTFVDAATGKYTTVEANCLVAYD
jgi:hypothetical protein